MSSKARAKVGRGLFEITCILVKNLGNQTILFSAGVSIYVKDHLSQNMPNWPFGHMIAINDESFQILKIKLKQLSIMGVYRSPSFASQGNKAF